MNYHFFNFEVVAFIHRNIVECFEQNLEAGEPKEDRNWCAFRGLNRVAVDFIEFMHKKKEN